MEAAPARRWRVPYEWILGSMLAGTFYAGLRHEEFLLCRAAWLLVALPLACVGFGVARATGEPKPRSAWLLCTAAFGWLYLGAWFSVIDAKGLLGEARDYVLRFFVVMWLVPPALCLASLIAVAWKPSKYRELGTFCVAATLLAHAWLTDLLLSPIVCGAAPPRRSPVREAAALVLTLAPLAWALWLMAYRWLRGSARG